MILNSNRIASSPSGQYGFPKCPSWRSCPSSSIGGQRRDGGRGASTVPWIWLVLRAFRLLRQRRPAYQPGALAPGYPYPMNHALKGRRIVSVDTISMRGPMLSPYRARPIYLNIPRAALSLCPGLVCGRAFSVQEPVHGQSGAVPTDPVASQLSTQFQAVFTGVRRESCPH